MTSEAIPSGPGKPGPNLIFIGPPGAGKGTLASKLCSLNIEHVSSGAFFRAEVARKTTLGAAIEKSLARGEFVPDEATLTVMRKWFFGRGNRKGFLLDGFPRNLLQARVLGEWLETRRETLSACVYLDLTLDEAIERITQRRVCLKDGAVYHLKNRPPAIPGICDLCGEALIQRADDTVETVRYRWELFERYTLPVVEYYREQGILLTFNASADPEVIEEEVLSSMKCLV